MPNKLAIKGGESTIMAPDPHYVWPKITGKTKESVLKQLDESISIYDRTGIIEKLENRLARYHGKKHALLTNSGTSAIHSMYVAAGLKESDEVICPAYTFHATVTPLFFTGAVPVLADCKSDGNIDPKEVERKITTNTRAIVVTHMWGKPCDMGPLEMIAKENNLLLFEDASHAHGATYKGRITGSFGDASAFSLQAQKTLTGGEGGFLLTDDDELFYKALLFGHYNKRCKKEIPQEHPLQKYFVTGMGLKLRIHPLAAAIAQEQFDNLECVLTGRRRIANKIISQLSGLPGIHFPQAENKETTNSWYALIIQYKPEELHGLPINLFYEALVAEGCRELDRPASTSPLNYHPLFQNPEQMFPRYKGKLAYKRGDFAHSESFYKNALKLPVWHDPDDEKIAQQYADAFKKVIENHLELLTK